MGGYLVALCGLLVAQLLCCCILWPYLDCDFQWLWFAVNLNVSCRLVWFVPYCGVSFGVCLKLHVCEFSYLVGIDCGGLWDV